MAFPFPLLSGRHAAAAVAIAAVAGTLVAQNGTGSQAKSGLGLAPAVVMMMGNNRTSAGSAASVRTMFAAARSSSERACASVWSRSGVATSDCSHVLKTNYFLSIPTGNGVDTAFDLGDFTSLDADGFTVNWASNRNTEIYPFLAIAGVSAKIGSFDLNTSAGNQAITGVGFQPKIVIFWTTAPDTTEGGTAELHFSFGAAISSSKRFSAAVRDRDGLGTSDNSRYASDNHCYTEISTTAVVAQADLQTMDSDGFTIDVETAPAAGRRICYLALGGAALNVDIGRKSTPTVTGNQAYTGFGFQPKALIFSSVLQTVASLETFPVNLDFCLGFATSASARAYTDVHCDDGAPTMLTGHDLGTSSCLHSENGSGTVIFDADLTSMDSDGCTLNFGTVNASAFEFHYIAFG